MQSDDEGGEDGLRHAHEAYAAYLERLRLGEKLSFEDLCAGHPGAEKELRTLHSVFELGQSFAGSSPIRERLDLSGGITVSLGVPSTDAGGDAESAPALTGSSARYALLGEVTRGGMGIIYRLRDRKLNRTIAMKVLLEPGATKEDERSSSQLLARFTEEAQITAQLDHPGIVPVHEAGVDADGRPYFTMRLVKGRELGEVFRLARDEREGWNLARAVSQLVKACQAVAFAHARGVLHRDLKPSNLMVGGFGEVYVMDWGLAKVTGRKDLHDLRLRPDPRMSLTSIRSDPRRDTGGTSDSPLITLDGSVMGTPAFMAPEQAKGMVEEIDCTSDVYSLGAILYELLAGHPPYLEPGGRLSPRTILAAVVHGPPAGSTRSRREHPRSSFPSASRRWRGRRRAATHRASTLRRTSRRSSIGVSCRRTARAPSPSSARGSSGTGSRRSRPWCRWRRSSLLLPLRAARAPERARAEAPAVATVPPAGAEPLRVLSSAGAGHGPPESYVPSRERITPRWRHPPGAREPIREA